MSDNDEFSDAAFVKENPMVRCDICGHEVPESNTSLHAARCGSRSCNQATSSRVQRNTKEEEDLSNPAIAPDDMDNYDGDEEDGIPGLDTTNGSYESNVDEEAAAVHANTDSTVKRDIEEGGAGEEVRRECCICMDEIETNDDAIGCTGSAETHYLHTKCGLEYVASAVVAGGAFEGMRTQRILAEGQQEPLTSAAGELPCPSFVAGCDCAALPNNTIFRMLGNSRDASEHFMRAYKNVNIREAILDQPSANSSNDDEEGAARNALPVADQIYHRVADALSRGYQMSCPRCRQQGTKDSECMHIHCPTCGSNWCYCCGRFRLESGPADARCRGCDSTAIYIERQPGWDSFALPGTDEDAKTGALWQFHQQVQKYYVGRIKEETPPDQWEAFMQAYPRVLENTPTFGRHIMWDDLDSAQPPVFGNSVENDLMWKLQPVLLQQQPQQQQQRPPPPQQLEDIGRFKDIFETEEGKLWIVALLFTVVFLIFKWTIGSPGLSVLADTLVAATSFVGLSYTLLWCTDYFAANPNHIIRRSLPEAFLVGKLYQRPLLSSVGRFRSTRRAHVYFWIGSLALGSLLVGISNEFGTILVLHNIGTTILTFALVCCALEMAVGNMSSPPDLENEAQCDIYRTLTLVSAFFVLCLSLGAGLMSGESYGKVRAIGVFLLCAGIGALTAELVPRLFRQWDTIWMPLEDKTRKTSYLFFLSVTIGSSLCWLGNVAAMVAGIFMLVFGVIYSWCLCAQLD